MDMALAVLSVCVILAALCLVFYVDCQTSLSQNDKDYILEIHNTLRVMVSPTASNMERMVSGIRCGAKICMPPGY
jgi:hypothetical protein